MINLYAHYRDNLDTWASPDDIIAYWPTKGSGPSHKFSKLYDGIKEWPGSVKYFRLMMYPDGFGPHGHYVLFAGNVYAMEDCPALACVNLGAIDCINRGELDLTLFFVHETFDHWSFEHYQTTLRDRLSTMKITRPGSVRVVTSTKFDQTLPNDVVKWIYHPWHGGEAQQQAKKFFMTGPPTIIDPRTKRQAILCLNNRMTQHRYTMLKHLEHRGLKSQCLISVNHNRLHLEDLDQKTSVNNDFAQWLQQNPMIDVDNYINSQDEITGVKKSWMGSGFLYQRAGWDLVQETHADIAGGVYITANTWRAMLMGVPFLINGTAKSLALLRELGYRTFEGIIDERYDNELDTQLRISMIADQVARICRGEIIYDWETLKEILLHNQQLAWNHRYLATLHDSLIQ